MQATNWKNVCNITYAATAIWRTSSDVDGRLRHVDVSKCCSGFNNTCAAPTLSTFTSSRAQNVVSSFFLLAFLVQSIRDCFSINEEVHFLSSLTSKALRLPFFFLLPSRTLSFQIYPSVHKESTGLDCIQSKFVAQRRTKQPLLSLRLN